MSYFYTQDNLSVFPLKSPDANTSLCFSIIGIEPNRKSTTIRI